MATLVRHRWMTVAGVETFYREAGREDAPVLLLPHGYPCSSYEFRNLMPRLADHWRLIAPDFPGAGYSGTPDDFDYSFDGLRRLVGGLRQRDEGRPVCPLPPRLRVAYRCAVGDQRPQRIVALIIQNGDIPYDDALGPKYAEIEATWTLPRSEMKKVLAEAVSEAVFKEKFPNDLPPLWPIPSHPISGSCIGH
ncbi:alpha/beta fold hydrolase [Rhizobium leguminosarum]|uniref:Alpha/beta fold hydrolase n=1 Tax=Rhizobium ruizarguesonis TaxID=2081791 RepID=A0ACD5EXI0_9HYPH